MKPIVDVTKKILLFCMAFSLGTLKVAKAQSGWVQEAPAPGIMPVIDLATDNANRVYALTYPNSEIYYTQNNGSSWAKIPGTLPIHNIDDIEVDKASGTLYISCWNMGMYFTTNLGLTWQHVPFFTNPITGFHASIFKTTRKAGSNTVVCAEVQGHFYGTSSVIRYTNNNGASWSALPVNFGVRAFKFVSNGNLFAPANDGIYVSANNGASWASSSNGVAGLEMTCILEKVGSGTLFAGSKFNTNTNDTTGCGVFVSTDGGNTWINRSVGISDRRITSIEEAPTGELYACSYTGVYMSSDDGMTWTQALGGLNSADYLALSANSSGLFIGSRQSGVFLKTGAQNNWTDVNNGFRLGTVSDFCFGNNGGIFAIDQAASGVHYWNNTSWVQRSTGLPVNWGNSVLSTTSGVLYASFLNKGPTLFKSLNSGITWSPITSLPAQQNVFWASTVIKQDRFGNLYAWVAYSPANGLPAEVFRSTDGGQTWASVYTVNFSTTMELNDIDFASDSTVYYTTTDLNGATVIEYTKGWNAPLQTLAINISQSFAPQYRLQVAPNDSLYVTESTEIYARNGINNWVQLPNGGWGNNTAQIGGISQFIDNAGHFYATCVTCGAYTSANNGQNWQAIQNGIPLYTPPFNTPWLINFFQIKFNSANVPYAMSFDNGANHLMGFYKYTGTATGISSTNFTEDNALFISPNPAQDKLTITSNTALMGSLKRIDIYNSAGQLVNSMMYTEALKENATELDISGLPSGLYLIKWISGEKIITSRFVKQ